MFSNGCELLLENEIRNLKKGTPIIQIYHDFSKLWEKQTMTLMLKYLGRISDLYLGAKNSTFMPRS